MSPGNQGVFLDAERGGISRDFGILQLAKMDPKEAEKGI